MTIKYKFVEFHSPVFSQGKNHGTKIYANQPGKQTGVELYYDTELSFMCMKYKGQVTHFDSFHSGDVDSSEIAEAGDPMPKLAHAPSAQTIPEVIASNKKKAASKPAQVARASQGE